MVTLGDHRSGKDSPFTYKPTGGSYGRGFMRLKRWRPLLLVVIVFLLYKLYTDRVALEQNEDSRVDWLPKDTTGSPGSAAAFAGNDMVVFIPSSADDIWLRVSSLVSAASWSACRLGGIVLHILPRGD